MENTTAETMESCTPRKEIPEEICSNLQTMLELADLVKFAKWNPLPDENESSQQIAYDFILRTKLVPILRKDDLETTADQKTDSKEKEVKDVQ